MANPPPKIRWAVFAALTLLALAVRLPHLGERPMHTDESINAWLTGELLADHPFNYDPRDRHGPVLFALAKPIARICGAKQFSDLTEFQLRLTPVLVGSASILLFGAAVPMFGFLACGLAALLFAISPLPVYYSRYFIHETLFVACTLALLISGWQAVQKRSIGRAALAGVCAALLLACKETAVIHLFALGIAGIAVGLTARRGPAMNPNLPSPDANPSSQAETKIRAPFAPMLFATTLAFATTFVLLFSWFGRDWGALADLFHAIPNFANRAGGQGHEKPFLYYFTVLDPRLLFSLVALAGIYAALREAGSGAGGARLMLAVYGVVTVLIYSLIPYKTPWLALNLWLPLALLCGFGIEAVAQRLNVATARWFGGLVIGAFCVVAGSRTKSLAFDHPADEMNPLAYAHTGDDLLRLPPELNRLANRHQMTNPLIAVVATDPWPLPWYLRHYQRVGFWQPGQDPGAADFYLTSVEAASGLESRLHERVPEFFGQRPEVLLLLWPPPTPTTAPTHE